MAAIEVAGSPVLGTLAVFGVLLVSLFIFLTFAGRDTHDGI